MSNAMWLIKNETYAHSLKGCTCMDMVVSGGGLRGYYVTGANIILSELSRLKIIEVCGQGSNDMCPRQWEG